VFLVVEGVGLPHAVGRFSKLLALGELNLQRFEQVQVLNADVLAKGPVNLVGLRLPPQLHQ
jgi:hypothetical protein